MQKKLKRCLMLSNSFFLTDCPLGCFGFGAHKKKGEIVSEKLKHNSDCYPQSVKPTCS